MREIRFGTNMAELNSAQLADDMILELICPDKGCGLIHHVSTAELRAELAASSFQCGGWCGEEKDASMASPHFAAHGGKIARICRPCAARGGLTAFGDNSHAEQRGRRYRMRARRAIARWLTHTTTVLGRS